MDKHLSPPELTDEQRENKRWTEEYYRTSPGAEGHDSYPPDNKKR